MRIFHRSAKNLILVCRTHLGLLALVISFSTSEMALARGRSCVSLFKAEALGAAGTLTRRDGVKIRKATPLFLRTLDANGEPSAKLMMEPSNYVPPNIQIFDNRRLYEPRHMLRFGGSRLIKMYRGLAIEDGETLMLKSDRKGKPIWLAPDYEHARLYAAEWTPVLNASTTKAIILEMWIPEFLIYWRNDPRNEGMTEAFIIDTDVKTLESFVTKIHDVKKKKPVKTRVDPNEDLTFDPIDFGAGQW